MAKHTNNGECLKCEEIFNLYPGFHSGLKSWFNKTQRMFNDLHISCAGRGFAEQEAAFNRKASMAHYGKSAHNYNCAIDVFRLLEGKYDLDKRWFERVVKKSLTSDFVWYGLEGAAYYELPHIEVAKWKELRDKKLAILVE